MQRFLSIALVGGLLLSTSTACANNSSTADPQASTESTAAPPMTTESAPDAAMANLNTYDQTASGYPVTAQYPDTMAVDGGCGGEGCGFFFTFKPQGNALDEAEVHVFLPAGATTGAEQLPFVTGPNGLMENNGWTVDSIEADGSAEFPYPWVETVINFSTDQEQSGHILLGQAEGQAVQVMLLYPAEMADAYWPSAKVVLESLGFDADLLPIEASQV